jgi:mannosyltransferase OCH1-like enzyme
MPPTLKLSPEVRARWQLWPYKSGTPIPLQLFQTYKRRHLPPEADKARDTWLAKNSRWRLAMYLMDDGDIATFVRHFFGRRMWKVVRSFPLPVMKADFWRYAALYAYGGIYRCAVQVPTPTPPAPHTRIFFCS